MSITLVQHKVFHGSGATPALAFTNPTGAGNAVVVKVLINSADAMTCVDPHGDAMTARASLVPLSFAGRTFKQFTRFGVTAGSSAVTVTTTGGGTSSWTIWIEEWSGTGSLDSTNTATDLHGTGTSTTSATISVTPSVNGCAITAFGINGLLGPNNPAGGYTGIDQDAASTDAQTEYLVQTTATATQAQFTLSSAQWDAYALVLAPSGGGASTWGAQLADRHNHIVQ